MRFGTTILRAATGNACLFWVTADLLPNCRNERTDIVALLTRPGRLVRPVAPIAAARSLDHRRGSTKLAA